MASGTGWGYRVVSMVLDVLLEWPSNHIYRLNQAETIQAFFILDKIKDDD